NMQAELRAPRRRTRVLEEYEAPLPVGRSPEEESHFRAELLNQHVLVSQAELVLLFQGYFGKGVLSRARPDHGISDQWEREYEELLRWAGASLAAQGLDEETVNQTLLKLSEPVEMEDVRGEDQVENGQEEAGPEGGASSGRQRAEPEVHLEAERSSQSGGGNASLNTTVPMSLSCCCHGDKTGSEHLNWITCSPVCPSVCLLPQAFFLVYGLGCLSVHLQQEPLSVVQLWRKFRSLRADFVSSYAAYHHFRSRGWVPKGGGGAKYGVDLMLYRKGPPFYHASVLTMGSGAQRCVRFRGALWRLSAGSPRAVLVSQELMLCYIIYPADQSEAELDSPECLSRLKVQEVIVSRWVSSRERTEQDDI
uniref:tRNA-splicing endonuclease subunit Sen2 n=1 Tax=Stegastes partitus TaxID=144197 RepID=A0A3B5B7R5_9TELE